MCLPYVPATTTQVSNVRAALKGSKVSAWHHCVRPENILCFQGTLVDIGSGDGRLVVEAARMGFRATGVELNRWLVYYSRFENIC